jgi:general secretion pathway protein G
MTLIELMLVLAMVAVLAAVALPMYESYRERVRQSLAIQDITVLQVVIKRYATDSGSYPASLAVVGNGGKLDPWGRPYVYQELISVGSISKARKDRKFNPINSDFDLYSLGRDGASRQQLTNKLSLDDIVRANDGKYVGLASGYAP